MNAKRIKELVDDLGTLRAQLATLKDEESELRHLLIDADVKIAEGELFRVTVSRSTRDIIDWQKIAKRLKASRQIIRANTETKPVVIVRTSTRRGVVAS
jgi:hypothetical protein